MRVRGTDAIPLAPRPDLDQYRNLAKELAAACRTGEEGEVRGWAKAWIERLSRLRSRNATPEYVAPGAPPHQDSAEIEREVTGIVDSAREARLIERGERPVTLSDAQLFLARLHGFVSWPRFVAHVEARGRTDSPIARFEAAADAVVTGDIAALRGLLRARPQLVRARSSRSHRATLLHYVAANGHEGFRQRTPPNAVAIARMLLEAGAEVDALADMYARGCTTMEMLVSSTHPHAGGVQTALVETLLDHGAAIDGVENDGSPLMTALSFRFPGAAETLARRGARIDNILAAAGLGRVDLVDSFVTDEGKLRSGVPLADVPWPALPADPVVHLEHALTWACIYGHYDVARLLLDKGVSPDARGGDGTALHFAAAHGRLDLVRVLLEHGASLEARNGYGGTVLDGTLWYAFNGPIPGVDYAEVVRELLDAGARTDVYADMEFYIDAALAGRRGGGYPKVGSRGS